MRIRFKEGLNKLLGKRLDAGEIHGPDAGAGDREAGRKPGKERFHRADLMESSAPLHNPGCGWYHIYTFEALPPADGRPVEQEVWLDEACQEEQLALVLIDIGAFREGPISEEALLHIQQIFVFFRDKGKQMILRFVYDRLGQGLAREPASLGMVKCHIEQLGACIRTYAEEILVIQGIFVGNWGEMHGSKFLDDTSMCELIQTLYRVTEGKCFLAVRTPVQWRRIAARVRNRAELQAEAGLRSRAELRTGTGSQNQPGLLEKLALYNDGMFGSDTDLGTYGSAERAKAGDGEKWSRGEELAWQDAHLAQVPNGGEVLSGEFPRGYRQAAEDMRRMHVSYLNRIYHPDCLDGWKREIVEEDGCFAGLTGYDYIGRHLGYRFVVRDVSVRKGWELRIEVENCGFANLQEEAECILLTQDAGGQMSEQCLDTDARHWKSGKTVTLSARITDNSGQISLQLRRKRDGCAIRFANQGAGDRLLLGEYTDGQSAH